MLVGDVACYHPCYYFGTGFDENVEVSLLLVVHLGNEILPSKGTRHAVS